MWKFKKIATFFIVLMFSNSTFSLQKRDANCEIPKELLQDCGQIPNTDYESAERLKILFPWHVAIYKKENAQKNTTPINKCGGTLISPSVLLTAAHCVADDLSGNLQNTDLFYVTAGNEYREFNDKRDDTFRQSRKVKSIIIPPEYKGHLSNFIGDIAIITVDKPFILSEAVQLACLGTKQQFSQIYNHENGLMVGWGLTKETRDPNKRLSYVLSPIINLQQCKPNVDASFYKYFVHDKFCGVFMEDDSICVTDNGGGILQKYSDKNNIQRLYVQGISSVGFISGGSCTSKQYSAFTAVEPYLNLICQVLNQ